MNPVYLVAIIPVCFFCGMLIAISARENGREITIWPWVQKVVNEGTEIWHKVHRYTGQKACEYQRNFVIYEITNTWTGSVRREKVYLESQP